jgi:hypothetical protein
VASWEPLAVVEVAVAVVVSVHHLEFAFAFGLEYLGSRGGGSRYTHVLISWRTGVVCVAEQQRLSKAQIYLRQNGRAGVAFNVHVFINFL